MLSTITLASFGRASDLAAPAAPEGNETVDAGGLDSAAFLSLHMQAVGGELDELLPAYDPVAQHSPNGPWVFLIPGVLRDHLASLPDAALQPLAEEWSQCEELQDDGVEREDALEILEGMCALSRAAVATDKGLALWLSR